LRKNKRATIRETPGGEWRGYLDDARVADFRNNATETAQQVAERWLQQRNDGKKPKERKPVVAAPGKPAVPAPQAAPRFIEHVKINCAGVIRFGKQRDRRFLSLYWDMQDRFGDRNYGHEVCLHEAAHAVLMEHDGIQNVRFAEPDIIYDPTTDEFIATSARVIGDDLPDAIVDDNFIFKIVSHMAAGGVALRTLANIEECGDEGDFEYFTRKYVLNPPTTGETAEQYWKRVQDAVTARLSEPETRSKVLAKAQEYLRLLYPA
jgi:hypothetical protein